VAVHAGEGSGLFGAWNRFTLTPGATAEQVPSCTCFSAPAAQLLLPSSPSLSLAWRGSPEAPPPPPVSRGAAPALSSFSREALASSLPAVGLTDNFICQNFHQLRQQLHGLVKGSPTLRSGNAMTEVGWWKLTFLRKKKSTPKVLYEIPDTYTQSEGGAEPPRPDSGNPNSNFNTRLEKIVDKNTKGKHVKVSNSGRFKEKKKVRASLAENPNLFDDREGKGQ
uniref:Proline rich 15 like n=1 Tax=Bos taurus TaxID=9913 RepID=A0A3Q1MN41_BOVIN